MTVSPISLAAILAALPPALAAAGAQRLCPRIDTMIGAIETGGVAAATIGARGMDQPRAAGFLLPFI